MGLVELAKAQRVQTRERPRSHGEDVAQDAADAGGRAAVRLDVGRMVVALDLEDGGASLADVDHARVLSRAVQHPGCLRRQAREVPLAGLVGAVLGPHDREDPELRVCRIAA
jgi:hypothetical protein